MTPRLRAGRPPSALSWAPAHPGGPTSSLLPPSPVPRPGLTGPRPSGRLPPACPGHCPSVPQEPDAGAGLPLLPSALMARAVPARGAHDPLGVAPGGAGACAPFGLEATGPTQRPSAAGRRGQGVVSRLIPVAVCGRPVRGRDEQAGASQGVSLDGNHGGSGGLARRCQFSNKPRCPSSSFGPEF